MSLRVLGAFTLFSKSVKAFPKFLHPWRQLQRSHIQLYPFATVNLHACPILFVSFGNRRNNPIFVFANGGANACRLPSNKKIWIWEWYEYQLSDIFYIPYSFQSWYIIKQSIYHTPIWGDRVGHGKPGWLPHRNRGPLEWRVRSRPSYLAPCFELSIARLKERVPEIALLNDSVPVANQPLPSVDTLPTRLLVLQFSDGILGGFFPRESIEQPYIAPAEGSEHIPQFMMWCLQIAWFIFTYPASEKLALHNIIQRSLCNIHHKHCAKNPIKIKVLVAIERFTPRAIQTLFPQFIGSALKFPSTPLINLTFHLCIQSRKN